MKQSFSVTICFFIINIVLAQNQNRQIEINPYIRIDKYPQFSYVLRGRPSTDYINMKGTSFGINIETSQETWRALASVLGSIITGIGFLGVGLIFYSKQEKFLN